MEGTSVIPLAWFNCLDSKSSDDYGERLLILVFFPDWPVARVEPSEIGGRKMAAYILHKLGAALRGEADSEAEEDSSSYSS